jgi:transposase
MWEIGLFWVGNDDAGDRLAVLQSLVSTCELNGVNPQLYLEDVLIRIQDHPANRIDELLPPRWHPPDGDSGTPDTS